MEWINIKDRLPDKNGEYLTCRVDRKYITIYGFTTDAYKLDKYDFEEYKNQKKALFYNYDSEYGFADFTDYIDYWMELPALPEVDNV